MPEHNSSDPLPEAGGMEAQLASLYAEREQLQDALGTADAGEIIAMVQSLEAQCNDLYLEKDEDRKEAI
jgi:hypothetical protein